MTPQPNEPDMTEQDKVQALVARLTPTDGHFAHWETWSVRLRTDELNTFHAILADHARQAEEIATLTAKLAECEGRETRMRDLATKLLASIDDNDPAQWNCSTVAYSALQEELAAISDKAGA